MQAKCRSSTVCGYWDDKKVSYRQGKLQLHTRYVVPMSERIADVQFVRIEPHRTEDEKGVLQV